MALTKTTEVDKIEVVGIHKIVQVRTVTVVKENGIEISRSFHRHLIAPGESTTGEDPQVVAICNATHTQSVIDAYEAFLAESV